MERKQRGPDFMEHGVGYFAHRRINASGDDVTNAAWIQSIVA